MKTYEAMFLMDPALSSDWAAAESEVNRILQRAEVKVLGLRKWDERRLAYPIGRHKRGLYVLSFFEALPDKIAGLERDVQLSEKALRVLVLRRDKMSAEAVEKALAAEPPGKPPSRDDGGRARAGGGGQSAKPALEEPESADQAAADAGPDVTDELPLAELENPTEEKEPAESPTPDDA